MTRRLLDAYRRTGADLPFGDPRRAHGVEMEGYYWRFTDAAAGRVVVALCGVSTAADGQWAMVALAAHPGGFLREAVTRTASADAHGLGVQAEDVLVATADTLRLDLGPDARLEVRLSARRDWPRRAFGGLGPAHAVPGLGQYWHPHLLGATVTGEACIGGERIDLGSATAYAEKNWGAGFPREWWWGQAHGFADPEVCVAFAGGRLPGLGPVVVKPTVVVASVAAGLVRIGLPTGHVAAEVGAGGWRLRGRSALASLELVGDGHGQVPFALPVPLAAERRVRGRVDHQLAGQLTLTVRRGRRLLYRGESTLAGLEWGTAAEASVPLRPRPGLRRRSAGR
jgi:hypothetical protein